MEEVIKLVKKVAELSTRVDLYEQKILSLERELAELALEREYNGQTHREPLLQKASERTFFYKQPQQQRVFKSVFLVTLLLFCVMFLLWYSMPRLFSSLC